jgi:Tetracyclin repressor-like, C-terminal domain
VLSAYGIAPAETGHAIRSLRCMIHGFASPQAAGGFQRGNDPDENFDWMIRFVDAGLRTAGRQQTSRQPAGR